jgi:hypothetical protein
MIVMVAGSAVIIAGAIALAVMTRTTAEPLKTPEAVRANATSSTSGTSTSQSRRDSIQPTISDDNTQAADLAGVGNGSAGDRLARLLDEYDQHHWANAMGQCLDPEIARAGAKACAVSACEIHDAYHARAFYIRVTGADRGEVQLACEQAHVQLEHPHRPFFGPHHPPFRSPTGSGG